MARDVKDYEGSRREGDDDTSDGGLMVRNGMREESREKRREGEETRKESTRRDGGRGSRGPHREGGRHPEGHAERGR